MNIYPDYLHQYKNVCQYGDCQILQAICLIVRMSKVVDQSKSNHFRSLQSNSFVLLELHKLYHFVLDHSNNPKHFLLNLSAKEYVIRVHLKIIHSKQTIG